MKIACCQFNPTWGDVEGNIAMVNEMLSIYTPNDIDVLILPEMAFTGYVFESLEEIAPYLEDTETGPSVLWAKEKAVQLQCYVVVGFPEKKGEVNYNSLCCINPYGQLVSTYHKAFLFDMDVVWAKEGPGFVSLNIDTFGKVGFGICMDLNPYKFVTPFENFEFANYHLREKTDIIICCMAWLKSFEDTGCLSTIEYWALRLKPLYRDAEDGRRTIFAACNRIGKEGHSEFGGASCVLDISNKKIALLNYMERNTGVMITET